MAILNYYNTDSTWKKPFFLYPQIWNGSRWVYAKPSYWDGSQWITSIGGPSPGPGGIPDPVPPPIIPPESGGGGIVSEV